MTGKRTVSAALRVMGLGAACDFARYHYVLSRARWNARSIGRKLLTMILDRFLPSGPVVIGIDDTIERRRGHKMPRAASIAIRCVPRMMVWTASPQRHHSAKAPCATGSSQC